MTASVPGRRIALICYDGWDELNHLVHRDRNAEADESTVIYARKKRMAKNPPMELMISVMLHRMDDLEWTKEELSPIKGIRIVDIMHGRSPLGAIVTLSDGREYEIDFKDIDGKRTC